MGNIPVIDNAYEEVRRWNVSSDHVVANLLSSKSLKEGGCPQKTLCPDVKEKIRCFPKVCVV